MKKAIILLVSVSVFAFFVPVNHVFDQKVIQVADVQPNIEPIYPPF